MFAFRESNEILTLMAFPVLKIQLHFFIAYDVSSGHLERLVGFFEVVCSCGFYHMGFFIPYLSMEISYMQCTFWFIGVLAGEFDAEA